MRKIPDIGLRIDRNLQPLADSFKTEIEADGLELDIQTFDSEQPYLSQEWAIPAVLGVYLLKSYFDGFLKEAGKDHYSLLKKWLKTKIETLRLIKIITIAAETSPLKIDTTNTQSKVFSIESRMKDNRHIKFLFDDNLNTEQWKLAIDKALDLLESHFENNPDTLTIQVNNEELNQNQIFGIINNETLEWEFYDYYKAHLRRLELESKQQQPPV